MNASIHHCVRAIVLSCTLAVAAAANADTMIVSNHNASMGPKHDAVAQCALAMLRAVGDGHGLLFTNRAQTARTAQGGTAVMLDATLWDNGARVPVQGRCERGATGELVATVARVRNDTAVAAQ